MNLDNVKGCLFGMAYGDALGAETEFMNMAGIKQRFPNGLPAITGAPALVTDDTQMGLALGKALMKAPRPYEALGLGKEIEAAFIEWYDSPDNNRAPGMTCLTSIENIMAGQKWSVATSISSKGCGANMRVQPIGLLPLDAASRAKIAQFQAAITHAHPTGLAAADITAWTIADLANGGDVATIAVRAYDYALSQCRVYRADWLGEIWQRAMVFPTAEDYIEFGWKEVIGRLEILLEALKNPEMDKDPCLITGAGWVAEEAYVTALYCFLLYPEHPDKAIERAALSSGDSDSLACIAGSFAGAYKGFGAWPASWEKRIEYQAELQELSDYLAAL